MVINDYIKLTLILHGDKIQIVERKILKKSSTKFTKEIYYNQFYGGKLSVETIA